MRRRRAQGVSRRAVLRSFRYLHEGRGIKIQTVVIVLFLGALGAALGATSGTELGGPGRALAVLAGLLIGALLGLVISMEAIRVVLNQTQRLNPFRRVRGMKLDGLALRPVEQTDADSLFASYDQEALDASGLPESTAKDSRTAAANGLLNGRMLAITDDEHAVLGFVSFNGFREAGDPEFGFWLLPAARGRGLGASVVAMLGQLARKVGHDHAWLGMRTTNGGMIKSCERAGAVRMAELPHRLPNGEVTPSAWYRL